MEKMQQLGRQARARAFEPPAPPPVAGRIPPHDLDAEAAVLSAILLERDALDKVLELLQPDHFAFRGEPPRLRGRGRAVVPRNAD